MRKRLRELGYPIGRLPVGEKNCITDVPGVKVGHVTLFQDLPDNEAVRTGVTSILPHGGNLFYDKVPAASFVLNGFGKTTGLVQVEELGVIESPIMLTNTFSLPAVVEGTLQYMLAENKAIGEQVGTINIVAGECNDSYLNDIRGLHVRPTDAIEAINKASDDKVQEGAVGAGTGMSCFGWKGGIGTSSRVVRHEEIEYTIGSLVLSNFGHPKDIIVLGNPIGHQLQPPNINKPDDGSIMLILATDAPLDARQLKRLAKRAALGLSRTGAVAHHGSGDIIIAFSNANKIPHIADQHIVRLNTLLDNSPLTSKLFDGVVEAVEEAVLNSLFMAETTKGRLNRIREEIPIDEILKILK